MAKAGNNGQDIGGRYLIQDQNHMCESREVTYVAVRQSKPERSHTRGRENGSSEQSSRNGRRSAHRVHA